MKSELYEIIPSPKGRLAVMPHPRGHDWLEDEMSSLHAQEVTHLISALTPPEILELGLEGEPQAAAAVGMAFLQFPIEDRGLPASADAFGKLISTLLEALQSDAYVAAHCRGGIGRSSLIIGALLIRMGLPVATALDRISGCRGCPVPDTEEQAEYLKTI
jgi:protein-tyrosine phosphatase